MSAGEVTQRIIKYKNMMPKEFKEDLIMYIQHIITTNNDDEGFQQELLLLIKKLR